MPSCCNTGCCPLTPARETNLTPETADNSIILMHLHVGECECLFIFLVSNSLIINSNIPFFAVIS